MRIKYRPLSLLEFNDCADLEIYGDNSVSVIFVASKQCEIASQETVARGLRHALHNLLRRNHIGEDFEIGCGTDRHCPGVHEVTSTTKMCRM